jgi:hypothetical protein
MTDEHAPATVTRLGRTAEIVGAVARLCSTERAGR